MFTSFQPRKEDGIMLKETKRMEGYALHARDGVIGQVKDFYFEDQDWHVRYLVVSTGSWLKGRNVLISPEVVHAPDWGMRVFPVELTTDQVRSSPDVDTDKPVSRQHEMELRRYYGWPPYWGAAISGAGLAQPILEPAPGAFSEDLATDGDRPLTRKGNPHLRSVNDTKGYHIEARDGEIGHVDDFLVEGETWRVWYLVVDTRNWWPGKKVLVSPAWIQSVRWDRSHVVVDLTRDAIKSSPEYDPAAHWNPEYAARLHEHYQRPLPAGPPTTIIGEKDNPNRT
jgi:uncharacterized protein YrrD